MFQIIFLTRQGMAEGRRLAFSGIVEPKTFGATSKGLEVWGCMVEAYIKGGKTLEWFWQGDWQDI